MSLKNIRDLSNQLQPGSAHWIGVDPASKPDYTGITVINSDGFVEFSGRMEEMNKKLASAFGVPARLLEKNEQSNKRQTNHSDSEEPSL